MSAVILPLTALENADLAALKGATGIDASTIAHAALRATIEHWRRTGKLSLPLCIVSQATLPDCSACGFALFYHSSIQSSHSKVVPFTNSDLQP